MVVTGSPGPDRVAGGAGGGRTLLQRYRLVTMAATGARTEIWEGVDDVLARSVTVKLLRPALAADPSVRESFRSETVAAARLSHPNVVATFDTGEADDTPFVVMELIRGRPLDRVLAETGPMSPAAVAAIGIQVADALAHAHEAGIVHGDLRPSTILVCAPEPGAPAALPRIKVSDFGLGRSDLPGDEAATSPGDLSGAGAYLPPERVGGGPPGAPGDVYALGAVLYELLTGRTPVRAAGGEAPRPRQLRAGVPRALEAVVCRALVADPSGRQASADRLAGELRAVDLADDDAVPAVVRDPTPPAGSPSFRHSERAWIVPAVVISMVAVALVAAGLTFSRSDVGRKVLGGAGREGGGEGGTQIRAVGAHSFDPQGDDGEENADRAGAAVDGDPASTWSTVRYQTRAFGGLKEGVGLWVELPEPSRLRRAVVTSPTQGWDAEVYVSPAPGTTLAEWGSPAARRQGIGGTVEFDLDGRQGRAVLVWITALGEGNRVEIGEFTLER